MPSVQMQMEKAPRIRPMTSSHALDLTLRESFVCSGPHTQSVGVGVPGSLVRG
jgi:hypothetical protein